MYEAIFLPVETSSALFMGLLEVVEVTMLTRLLLQEVEIHIL
jgi:hypothetical protein